VEAVRALVPAVACILVACGPPQTVVPDAGDDCNGPTKTPPNLVKNPGFECGGDAPAEWSPFFGDLAFVADAHSGSRAAKVTATANGSGQFSYAPVVVTAADGAKTYCAAAWMKGSTPNARLSLLVDVGGGGTEYTFTSPISGAWIRLPPTTNLQVPAPRDGKVYLRFQMKDATAGDTLLVDDLDVWESGDGRCQETR
jgi:hypothetical protein